ncbi:MAG: nitrilase family protein [Muribaculaceae bacterium]|jgi:predicted amidohydrolase|nr:nitrilase family protein [Muribaculaceae bacterium]
MAFSRNLKVTMLEHDIAWGDKQANLAQLERYMRNMPDDTDLVVLPEMFSTGFVTGDREAASALAEWNTGDTMRTLHRLAQEYRVAITGSFLANTAAQLYNRAFFIEPNGEETFYDKRHLFSFGGEDKVFNQGVDKESPIVRFRGFNIKLVVCYDLRFPVFCRNVNNNYDLLLVVANWPKAREYAWRQLLIARALENECYVIGVNRCGTDSTGIDYSEGSSLCIDFKGKILAQRMTSPIITAELSPALLAQFREKFPAWRDADPFTLK